jgi:beta-N-acetylhexosaminidase
MRQGPERRLRLPARTRFQGGLPRSLSGLVFLLMLVGCAPGPPHPEAPLVPGPGHATGSLAPAPDPEGARWVEEALASLTLSDAVGQLVFPWLSGSYAAEDDPEFLEAVRWVEEDRIGGVVISIGTPLAYAAKLNALQARARVPLLVTSDFEQGGPGMRINHSYALPSLLAQGGGTSFPPTMAFGAVGSEELVEAFGRVTGLEARAVGVHVAFAPVLDVNSNPENPIISTRAFGESPEEVTRLGRAWIRGARAGGVLSTAKHFPGHGDTRIDSHLELPEVTADRARLDRVELPPFRGAVEEGVDGIMTAHVSVPGVLGPGAPPATLAPEFMTRLLRDEMGFDGILYTDALRMGAITEHYGAGEAAVLALEAGADALLVPASVPEAVQAVVAAVEQGRLSRERIDRSVRRLLEEKARVGLHRERSVPLDGVAGVVGRAEHRALAEEAAARSMTLLRDRESRVPLDPMEVRRVLSITYGSLDDLIAGREFDAMLRAYFPELESARIGPDTDDRGLTGLLDRARGADVVVLGAYVPPRAGAGSVALPPAAADFVEALVLRHPTVLISFGNPYLLSAFPDVGSYLVAWGGREVSQGAAARALAGAAPISGRSPITIPGLHARGEGLSREANPVMAARGAGPRDALDEAGLLRRVDDPRAPVWPGVAPGTDPEDAGAGTPVPLEWLDLTVSPLEGDPEALGMDPAALDTLDALIREALADSAAPGAALAVGRSGGLVRLRGYGRLDWAPESAPVTPATLFDLASLTKVVGTTTAIMLLVEDGTLSLDDPVVRYLPGWARGDERRREATIRHLLLHRSGFEPFVRFFLELDGESAIRSAVYDLPLLSPPGEATVYSDIGFKTLAWVVEAVSGARLDRFLEERLFGPLGMTDTGFLPDPELRWRTAPTEWDREWRGYQAWGEVHDENAHALGGVAGHAGLFSTAQDLAVFVQLMARSGGIPSCVHRPGAGMACGARSRPADVTLMAPGTVAAFTSRADPEVSRALGWDTPAGRSSAGDYFSARSFGHTGFTGTSIWVDPELDLWVVLLTSRVNPTRENTRHIPLRREVHDAAAAAVRDRPVTRRDGS